MVRLPVGIRNVRDTAGMPVRHERSLSLALAISQILSFSALIIDPKLISLR